MQEVFKKIDEEFAKFFKIVENDNDEAWNRAVFKCCEIVKQIAKDHEKNVN